MRINSYKELKAYERGFELVKKIYLLTKNFPKEELYGLVSQLRRCAVSIPSNIAEGYMRGSKEYIQFLRIALGSAAELETQISLSFELGYCNKSKFEEIHNLIIEIIKLLSSYIKRLSTNR